MKKKLLNKKEAAKFIGVHPRTISNWVDQGLLTEYYANNKRPWFLPYELNIISIFIGEKKDNLLDGEFIFKYNTVKGEKLELRYTKRGII